MSNIAMANRTGADDIRFFRPSRSCAYEGWTVAELKKRAKQLGISGYSGLSKEKLISLIRSY
ncbi:Rho termination factor N-terminal domain-containing protein [Mycobacterium sp. M26]|uniref:Rho termination factor N-terminal domain-containing protein n=1 Tax=Mycobacterium sp. M26 TaxID=1762962 RepID=UPI000ACB0B60|nr:Rho termination factor N-terminal domain-containing protein [Mycobacterium sp. M26]